LGIGAGVLDALGFRPLIGSLVIFGLNELSELVYKSGGKKETVYGLSCLGDIEATFFSLHSRSRNAGFSIVNNTKTDNFVPGFYTSETILKIAKSYNTVMPLFETINQIIKKEVESQNLIKCITQYKCYQPNEKQTNIKTIYYSRAMDGFKFEEIKEIYKRTDKLLKENGLVLLNNNQELLKDSAEIICNNMRLLEQADCAIIDLSIKNHLYVGCIDEMVCANLKNIFVIVISGNSGVEKHLYANYRANKIVRNFEDVIEYINLLNKEKTI
jgi:hypothetical protein